MTTTQHQLKQNNLITVSGLTRRFESGGTVVTAVNSVDLEVPAGQFIAIVGRSGSGKTTLLNLIAGLDSPDKGSVFIDGQEVSGFSDRQSTKFRREQIGFVFQSFGLLPLLSAAENIDLALRIAGSGIRERNSRTRELLEQVSLTHRADHRPYELSGGEQQRVAVARALANNAPLIIADEPTGELDSTTGAQIFSLLREIADSGVTIVTATHDPFVMEHVDLVREMADGALLPLGEGVVSSRLLTKPGSPESVDESTNIDPFLPPIVPRRNP